MTKEWHFRLAAILFLFLFFVAGAAINLQDALVPHRKSSDEEQLLGVLFVNYNQFARPVLNSSSTVTVAIQFSLMHIKDLDIRSQVFTTTGLLILEWTDERLTWNPEEHNGITEIVVEARALWKPEFAVINGAEKIYEEYNQFRAVISSRGLIHWEPGGVFKTMCEIDVTYYPFDEQRCQLTFGAWSYHVGRMNLTTPTNFVNLDSYKKNGEWEILNTTARRNEFSYECCPLEKFSNVAFTVFLRRRHMFYVMNVIMPSIMTSVLLLSVFFCTPAQKVQIGVVVLLSFRIFLLNVAENIPKTSDHIPLLVIYLTCTLAITTMSMVLTVFVLNLYGISDQPVPRWIRALILIYLARFLGMCDTAEIYERARSRHSLRAKHRKFSGKNSYLKRAVLRDAPVSAAQVYGVADWIYRIGGRGQTDGSESSRDNLSSASAALNPKRRGNGLVAVSASTVGSTSGDELKDVRQDYSRDWRRVAEVFDRFFFWTFLLAITVSTTVLFHPLMSSVTSTELR